MKLVNRTPFAAFAFRQLDAEGALDCVVAVRGTFTHRQGDVAPFAGEQMPFQWTDAYEGDPATTPLLHQGDLVPDKPGTDVTFLGSAFAPEGGAASWTCRLTVGPVDKTLRVSGPRAWRPVRETRSFGRTGDGIVGWELGDPVPAEDVRIDWRLAYGGADGPDAPEGEERDPRNPLGCGRVGPPERWRDAPLPAPQVLGDEDPTFDGPVMPAGFGPVASAWADRQRHVGTYDDAWRETRHPLLPRDFDPRFWQCAPPDQVVTPHLASGAAYALENLHPTLPVAAGRLPDFDLAVHCVPGDGAETDGAWHVLALDGVQFDWREDDLIHLTWRARFPLPDAGRARLTLERVRLADPADIADDAAADDAPVDVAVPEPVA